MSLESVMTRADWFSFFQSLRRLCQTRFALLQELGRCKAQLPFVPLNMAPKERCFSYRQVQSLLLKENSLNWDDFLDELLLLKAETSSITILKDNTLLVDCSMTKEWKGSLEELMGVGHAELGKVRALSLCGVFLMENVSLP